MLKKIYIVFSPKILLMKCTLCSKNCEISNHQCDGISFLITKLERTVPYSIGGGLEGRIAWIYEAFFIGSITKIELNILLEFYSKVFTFN